MFCKVFYKNLVFQLIQKNTQLRKKICIFERIYILKNKKKYFDNVLYSFFTSYLVVRLIGKATLRAE